MPTFQSFCEGRDIPDRIDLGLIPPAGREAEERGRRAMLRKLLGILRREGLLPREGDGASPPLRAVLEWLGRSPARYVLVNLEDLWGEIHPQNTPGTVTERPNWRRRARHGVEGIRRDPEIRRCLNLLDRARRTRRG